MNKRTFYAMTKETLQIDVLDISFSVGDAKSPTYFKHELEGPIEVDECGLIEYYTDDAIKLTDSKPFPQRLLDSYPKIDKTTSLFTWRELIEAELCKWADKNLGFEEDDDAVED